MDKKKISKKPKKSPKKSTLINGVKLVHHDPSSVFRNSHSKVKKALAEALLDGDKEAFVEILSAYVRINNIFEVCRRTGLSRTVVYEAMRENGNPSLNTICKIFTSFKNAA